MESVSIQKLKASFAYWAARAAAGETVQITRHNRAYVQLTGCRPEAVHEGCLVGKELPKPELNGPTRGKWRKVLADDREEGR